MTYLADTSAWHRSGRPPILGRWTELLFGGELAICSPVQLELSYSAHSHKDHARLRDDLTSLPELPLDQRAVKRAEDVQAALVAFGQHRGPTPIDLYVAAIAEVGDVTLLHYDRHFDAIAQITGQRTEWIAPRGTLD